VRNRRGLNRIGMLAIAMIIALGAVGVTYGAWVDEITITGTLSSSGINTTLECGTCYFTGTPAGATNIACDTTSDPLEVEISVTSAQLLTDYYCPFTVDNTAAKTLPVKIVDVTVAQADTDLCSSGVSAVIENPPAAGTVLDPGVATATGSMVHISLDNDDCVGATLNFTLTANVVRWNQ